MYDTTHETATEFRAADFERFDELASCAATGFESYAG